MAKINDLTVFPNTTPAFDDHVIGTDVSDTSNSANGEVVTFKLGDIANNLAFATAWHPYNMLYPGDGNTGTIYDFSVDGAQTEIVTPDFADGYEYALVLESLKFSGTTTGTIRVAFYKETDAAYTSYVDVSSSINLFGYSASGILKLPFPRFSSAYGFSAEWITALATNYGVSPTNYAVNGYSFDTTGQPVTKVKISYYTTPQNTTAGKVKLLRRKEYLSA